MYVTLMSLKYEVIDERRRYSYLYILQHVLIQIRADESTRETKESTLDGAALEIRSLRAEELYVRTFGRPHVQDA